MAKIFELTGLSTDTKPRYTDKKYDGAIFTETDTGNVYIYDFCTKTWNLQGKSPMQDGLSIRSIAKNEEYVDPENPRRDQYFIYYTNGTVTAFYVTNGEQGEPGKDMDKVVLVTGTGEDLRIYGQNGLKTNYVHWIHNSHYVKFDPDNVTQEYRDSLQYYSELFDITGISKGDKGDSPYISDTNGHWLISIDHPVDLGVSAYGRKVEFKNEADFVYWRWVDGFDGQPLPGTEGEWHLLGNFKGDRGYGITEIKKIGHTVVDEQVTDIYEIEYGDDQSFQFSVTGGEKGAIGPTGPAGLIGPTGPSGEAGPQGAEGPTGPSGEAGPTGAAGPRGLKGDDGLNGPTGPRGEQGPQGLIGPTGIAGPTGVSVNYISYDTIDPKNTRMTVFLSNEQHFDCIIKNGNDGQDGQDGRSIESITSDGNNLVINYDSGEPDIIDLSSHLFTIGEEDQPGSVLTVVEDELGNKIAKWTVPSLNTAGHGIIIDDNEISVDDEVGGDLIYHGSGATRATVGGLIKGETINDISFKELLDKMLYPYQPISNIILNVSSATTFEIGSTPSSVSSLSVTYSAGSQDVTNLKVYYCETDSDDLSDWTTLYDGEYRQNITLSETITFEPVDEVGNKYYFKAVLTDGKTTLTTKKSSRFIVYDYYVVDLKDKDLSLLDQLIRTSTDGTNIAFNSDQSVYYFTLNNGNLKAWNSLASQYIDFIDDYEGGSNPNWTYRKYGDYTITLDSGIQKVYKLHILRPYSGGEFKFKV